jgi:hypothetical protein
LLAHALVFASMPAAAQAEPALVTDRGVSPFVAARLGRQLVSRDARPFEDAGPSRAVELGVGFDGGSVFAYELGLRASTGATDVVSVFGGVRLDVMPEWWIVTPVIRGGLGIGRADAWTLGPHLDVGVRVDLGGPQLLVTAAGTAWIAPFVVDVGLRVALVGGRF